MGVNLTKGQRVKLNLDSIRVGLGWKPAQKGVEPDLDASVLLVDATRKMPDDRYFVFYNNLESPEGSVIHSGDSVQASERDRDEETIFVRLSQVDPKIEEIIFVVTIYEAEENGQNFGDLRDAYIRVEDQNSGEELMKYNLSEEFSGETGVEIARFYRKGEEWKFEAMGYGNSGGLEYFLKKYL